MFYFPISDHVMLLEGIVSLKCRLIIYARANVRITNKKTKGKFPWGHHVVWNGKQNIKAKEVYCSERVSTEPTLGPNLPEHFFALKGDLKKHQGLLVYSDGLILVSLYRYHDIRFIQHKHLDFPWVNCFVPKDPVQHSSRCSKYNVVCHFLTRWYWKRKISKY